MPKVLVQVSMILQTTGQRVKSIACFNLVPRVLRLFGQWLVAKRDFADFCSKTMQAVQEQPIFFFSNYPEPLLATNHWPKILRTLVRDCTGSDLMLGKRYATDRERCVKKDRKLRFQGNDC